VKNAERTVFAKNAGQTPKNAQLGVVKRFKPPFGRFRRQTVKNGEERRRLRRFKAFHKRLRMPKAKNAEEWLKTPR